LSAATCKKTSWAVLVGLTLAASAARAAEATRVVSALDDDNRFDFNLSLQWLHTVESAYIKRESQPPLDETGLIKDLTYGRRRDVLNLRADFGILWDVGVHVVMPLVLSDATRLDFDRSEGSNCVYPDMAMGQPTCVDRSNSTILRDGILPDDGTYWGLDAVNNRGFSNPTGESPGPGGVFRGPKRKGFESLGVGVTWAAFNQARDDTKPTWTLSFDAFLDVFKDKRFDPANPTGNTAVGLGYHQLMWSTWISKRFRHFDPYFGAWYSMPVRTNGSVFSAFPAQTGINPQHQAGVTIGVEQVAWENVPARQRVTVEGRFHLREMFYGRSHSEIWEPLTGSSACSSINPGACRAGIDLDLDGDGISDTPHPGVSNTEAHATFGGDLGLNIQVGRFVRFRGLFGLMGAAPHFLTNAGTGSDRNGDGRVDTSDRSEVNPVYREAIDLPGRRFRVEGTKIWTLFLEGSIMF
jgi:hypothetical protein